MLWGSRAARAASRTARRPTSSRLSTLALAVVLYLAYASFFILKEVCPLCVTTYVAVIGVFVISGGASSVPMSSLPTRALRDIRVLVATPVALFVALLFVAGAASARRRSSRGEERPAVRRRQPLVDQDQRSELERWWDLQPRGRTSRSRTTARRS